MNIFSIDINKKQNMRHTKYKKLSKCNIIDDNIVFKNYFLQQIDFNEPLK